MIEYCTSKVCYWITQSESVLLSVDMQEHRTTVRMQRREVHLLISPWKFLHHAAPNPGTLLWTCMILCSPNSLKRIFKKTLCLSRASLWSKKRWAMTEKFYFPYLSSLKLLLISAFISLVLIKILCFPLIRKIWERQMIHHCRWQIHLPVPNG